MFVMHSWQPQNNSRKTYVLGTFQGQSPINSKENQSDPTRQKLITSKFYWKQKIMIIMWFQFVFGLKFFTPV